MKFCDSITYKYCAYKHISYNYIVTEHQHVSKLNFTQLSNSIKKSLISKGSAKTVMNMMLRWNYVTNSLWRNESNVNGQYYQNFKEFIFNLNKDYKNRNINWLFSTLYKKSQIAFKITCAQVNKKYRKKLKAKYTFELNYLPSQRRVLFFIKNFVFLVKKSNSRGLLLKYNSVVNDLFYNFQNSELLQIKKLILNQISKKK